MKKADIEEITLRRAKQELGVKVVRVGGSQGEWYWKLSKDDQGDQTHKGTQMITFKKDPEPLSDNGSDTLFKDDHMITFNEQVEPIEPQLVQAAFKDDHQSILREKPQDDHDDHQIHVPRNRNNGQVFEI